MHGSCAGARFNINNVDRIGFGPAAISGILAVVTAVTILETQGRSSPKQAVAAVYDQAEGLSCISCQAWISWTFALIFNMLAFVLEA